MIIDLTSTERRLLLHALFRMSPGLTPGLMQVDIDNITNRLIALREDDNESNLRLPLEPHGSERSAVSSVDPGKTQQLPGGVSGRTQSGDQPKRAAQMELADRWASGVEPPDKAAAEKLEITPSKIERKASKEGKPFLLISWSNNGRGYSFARVWDEALFSRIENRAKTKTLFYALRKGQFLNVIGVRA